MAENNTYAEEYKKRLDAIHIDPIPENPDGTYFQPDIEYHIVHLEDKKGIENIMDKRVHVYTTTCKCAGNAIKIDVTGEFKSYEVLDSGEVMYTMVSLPDEMGATSYYSIGTRSSFLRFTIVKE